MARRSKSSKELSGGCLSLFGLPFLAGGLVMSGLYFAGYAKWWAARGWDEVPCRIEAVEMKGDGETYQTTARYRYDYAGRSYQGERVSFYGGADNIGDFQQKSRRELAQYVAAPARGAERDTLTNPDKLFRCYVNPAAPGEAVLYRSLRWPMQAFLAIFALSFPAVGAGLVAGGLVAMGGKRAEQALRERHPEEPWKWKPNWAQPSIPETATPWNRALYVYTLWSAVVIFPLIWASASSGAFQEDGWAAWCLLVFVALWGIPASYSLRQLRHRLAVGATRFEPREAYSAPGGTLRGAVLMEKPLSARAAAQLELVCEKCVTHASSDGDSTTTETVWSHRESVPTNGISRDLSGYRLPVAFDLPADAPPSGPGADPRTCYQWMLRLKVPGTAVRAAFELPVFRGNHPLELVPMATLTAGARVASILDDACANLPALLGARGMVADFDAAGLPRSIICPAARHRGMIAFLFVFNLIWTGLAVLLIKLDAPLVFRLVWPLSALAIWLALFWNLLHKRSVRFSAGGLEVSNQLGPVVWQRTVSKPDINRFSHDTNMSSNQTRFYRVRVHNMAGKAFTLADGMTDATTAEALATVLDRWRRG